MKTIRISALALGFSLMTSISHAQEWQGQFQTKYGTLRLVQELGFEYPGGGIVYGDYGNNGTLVGQFDGSSGKLVDYFFNGNQTGKFILNASKPSGATYYPINFDFYGTYGYGENDNAYSANADWQWTGKKQNNSRPSNLSKAVWSGKWNTNFGEVILQQVGNKVTGKYKDKDKIEATYDPANRTLKGTFTNGTNSGRFEWKWEGNKFTGKWGWGNSLNGGEWKGDKQVKTNQYTASSNSSGSTNAGTNSTAPVTYKKYRVRALDVVISESGQNVFSADAPAELYGFAGFRMQKATASKTESFPNFGNQKDYYFDRTENNHVRVTYNKNTAQYKYVFPVGTSFRDYLIPVSDLNQQTVDFYITAWAHFKEQDPGTNDDFGKKEMRLSLKTLEIGKIYTLANSTGDGSYKLSFKVELVD